MKDTSVEKVRKTCGNCEKVDHKQGMCTKSGNFVNMGKGRPNCKNWRLEEVVIKPIAPAEPIVEIKDVEKKVEVATGVPAGSIGKESTETAAQVEAKSHPASVNGSPCQCGEHKVVKDHPMRKFLKKIGIIGK